MAPQSLTRVRRTAEGNLAREFSGDAAWIPCCLMLRRPTGALRDLPAILSLQPAAVRGQEAYLGIGICSLSRISRWECPGCWSTPSGSKRTSSVADKSLQRHTVLQGDRSQCGDGVHKPRDRAAFFCHLYKDLAHLAVLVKPVCM